MEALVISTTLAGSLAAAFLVQKAILEAWLHAMSSPRERALTYLREPRSVFFRLD